MKPLLAVLITVFANFCLAQTDTLFYDSATGNYVIRYVGHFTYVLGVDGTLRSADKDEALREGERIIERDSTVTVIFEPGTKVDPKVICTVTFDTSRGIFQYRYEVENGKDGKQTLTRFLVEFGTDQAIGKTESSSWRATRQTEVRNEALVSANRWGWSGSGRRGIPPGSSQNGFVLESPDLPGIASSYSRGGAPILAFPDEGPLNFDLVNKIARLRVFPADHVLRNTLAPFPPPKDLPPVGFVDILVSYKHQAYNFGWITNKGIFNSLDQKLDNARKQLQRGNNRAAKNVLEAFINEVEAQKEKHLSSEAYALLKFNAEYLISKLQ